MVERANLLRFSKSLIFPAFMTNEGVNIRIKLVSRKDGHDNTEISSIKLWNMQGKNKLNRKLVIVYDIIQ